MASNLEFVVVSLVVKGAILESVHRRVNGNGRPREDIVGPYVHSLVLKKLELVDVASSEEAKAMEV